MTSMLSMEIVVAVAIAVLGTIFLASLVALIAVCSHRKCKKPDLITRQQTREQRPDAHLVENMEPQSEAADVELEDVGINANLEQILEDEAWVNDITGLAPHCLDILKTCHTLTEKLVGMTMGNGRQLRNPELLTDIVAIAKKISPRVDDVVRSLYPPLDPRLLEARCTALVLSVSHLVLVTKNACRLSGVMDWIDQSLADIEEDLALLREASLAYESAPRYQQAGSVISEGGSQVGGNNQSVGSTQNLSVSNQNLAPAPPTSRESSEV